MKQGLVAVGQLGPDGLDATQRGPGSLDRRSGRVAPPSPVPAAADAMDPAGVYFGTRSGKLYASANEGGSWAAVAEGLPPIVSVVAAAVA